MILIVFLIFLKPVLSQEVCPGWTDEKLVTLLSSAVSGVCKIQDFESCRLGTESKKCSALERANSIFWEKFGKKPNCSALKSYGGICRQNWTMSFACKCEPASEANLPIYQFNCAKAGKAFECFREKVERLANLKDAPKELLELIGQKCQYVESPTGVPPFDFGTYTFVTDTYGACVLAQVNRSPKEQYCDVIAGHSPNGTHWADICWMNFAVSVGKSDFCERIKGKPTKAKCVTLVTQPDLKICSGAGLSKEKQLQCARIKSEVMGLDFCSEIIKIADRDHCYYELAMHMQDPFYCKFIRKAVGDKDQKESNALCVQTLARNFRSQAICDLISSPNEYRACMAQAVESHPKIKK